jgi:hypothetical protein
MAGHERLSHFVRNARCQCSVGKTRPPGADGIESQKMNVYILQGIDEKACPLCSRRCRH